MTGFALYSKEILVHYRCSACNQWWTIGDDKPEERGSITCPHCSATLITEEISDDHTT